MASSSTDPGPLLGRRQFFPIRLLSEFPLLHFPGHEFEVGPDLAGSNHAPNIAKGVPSHFGRGQAGGGDRRSFRRALPPDYGEPTAKSGTLRMFL